jgi:hypothetical protein
MHFSKMYDFNTTAIQKHYQEDARAPNTYVSPKKDSVLIVD